MASNGEGDKVPSFSMPKFGFKINNKALKPKSTVVQLPSRIHAEEADDNNDDNLDFVTSIDNNQIKGTKVKSSTKACELVIPLIAVNKYKITSKPDTTTTGITAEASSESTSSNDEDIASKAKQELLKEAKNFKGQEDADEIPAWKLMIINKVPDEYENDSKLDVSIRPEVSTLEDYQNIPIEGFGAALLRGMGWKNGEAIGGINKAVTPIFEPQLRAKGLGLGADASIAQQLKNGTKSKGTTDEALLRKGSYICVELGPFKGRYGVVQAIGDDLSHATIKLNLTKENIDLPQAMLRVVSKREFDQEGRILNKTTYDDYKLKDGSHSSNLEMKKRESQPSSSSSSSSNSRYKENEIWIMPNIRAEIRDKRFKDGKYYKEKVVILETKADRCTCRTKSHRVLEDISQSMLRTVIPRKADTVMVVRGQYRGKLATLEHVGRHEATVKLMGTISKPVELSLDDICEFYSRS